MALKTIALGE